MNKWEKEVQQSLLQDEQRVLKVLRMAYADVLRETNDRMADLFARITADPTDSAAVYQFRYQQQIQEQLEKILDGFADDNYKTISEYLEKSYENGYLGAMYDIHKQGIPIVTPIQQEQVVRAVTLDSPISIPMYTRLGNNIVQLKAAITAEVTRGAASGSMWKDVAARISDKGNVAAYNAMRIARTEGHRIQCAAQMDACRSARDAGADVVKQWDSTMDDRTRETHRQLHGQLRELDAPFEVNGMRAMQPGSFGRPEEDIHCRCALLQRARWALSKSELQVLRETDAAKEMAGASGFEDFKGKYLGSTEKLPENPDNLLDNSAESGIMKLAKGRTFEEYIANPSLLGESTPEEKYQYYKDAGFEVRPLGDGRFKGIPFEDGGGYRVYFNSSMQKTLMYHPEKRSHHTGEYYKLSEGRYGVHRFRMDGTPID